MVAYNKFNTFALDLGEGTHQLQAAGHQLDNYLSNATPSASLDAVKADLAEITIQNGYGGPTDVQNGYTESGGVGTMTAVDILFTATGAGFGPFQYTVLDNDTPASPLDPLIAWWDYGSAISPTAGETFDIDYGASVLTIT